MLPQTHTHRYGPDVSSEVSANQAVTCTVTTFNSCTKCVGSQSIIHDRTSDCNPVFHGHECMNDLTTERSFDLQARCVIDVLGLPFEMLLMVI